MNIVMNRRDFVKYKIEEMATMVVRRQIPGLQVNEAKRSE